MPLQTVESQRLYRQIADQLTALIDSGEFREGTRLPSERELAGQLQVSRPSVREALIALEVGGKVEVRVGSGIFVAIRRPAPVTDLASEGQGPFELLHARALIEGEIAAEAARRARTEDLDTVRAAVDEMRRRQQQGSNADESDRNFHIAVAKSAHNSVLVAVVQEAWDRGRGSIWRRMEHHFQTPQLLRAMLRDHEVILGALEQRDPRAARGGMHRHLKRVHREFSRRWESTREPGVVERSRSASIRVRPARAYADGGR
jgi:GntR family transcriptional repressor for pyruvate dehydrogenase complex